MNKELIDEYAMKLAINDLPMAYIKKTLTELVEKSINSTRRSERRAIGSNSKAKEICPFCQSNKIHSFTLIHSKCKDCKITWTN